MPHFIESPVSSSTMTSHSCSHSESTLLGSYILEASEIPEPTITTNATSNDHDPEHIPTTTTAAAATGATTAHLLSHTHLSPNINPSPPSYQTIHYFLRPPSPISPTSSPTITPPSTATTNLHDLHQSLLRPHDLDLLLQEPLVVLMLDERSVQSISIGEFLPGPYFPTEAEEHELAAGRVVQCGYALQRFLNTGVEEEANVVYALSIGGWCQDIRHLKEEGSERVND